MATELDRMMNEIGVSDKQMEFCEVYLRTLNASEAFRQAYDCSKLANWQIWAQARKKLAEKGVREYINARRKDAREELVVDTQRILTELSAIAFTDITDVVEFNDSGAHVKPTSQLSLAHKKAIKKVTIKRREHEHGENTDIVIEMHDKQRAIDTLCKHLGIIESAKNLTQNNVTNNVVVVQPKDLSTEQLKALVDAEKDRD